ncbi:nucleoside-triphosphatase [Acetobacterium wieringae]|uniref:nucleoside-triphosphatase n=1 Tax=Acetobacterium wieringae TaxID=52694 RepID=UPI0026EB5AFC|nr:nucleoside-triphosphatase [Acetobacterium wieringae]
MHVFLTGPIQIGKSTIIKRTLGQLNRTYGGFKTYFGPDRSSDDRLLYLNEAAEPKFFTTDHGIAVFKKDCLPQVDDARFNTDGVTLIQQAKANAAMIVMDECGNLERNALTFQREILNTLDGDTPVLGVIKYDSNGWTDMIRCHKKVKLITVTSQNRNELPARLVNYYLQSGCLKISDGYLLS